MTESRSHLSRHGDESGIAAVVVILSMFMLLAAGMVAVDAGMLWATKRNLVPATDAAALAGAQYLDGLDEPLKTVECNAAALENDTALPRTSTVSQVVQEYLTLNEGANVELDDLEVSGCGTQIVVVEVAARKEAPRFLSQAFGYDAIDVPSSSKAHAGPTGAGEGLLPIALCVHAPELQAHLAGGDWPASFSPDDYPAADGPVYRIYLEGDQASTDCGETLPGNWGWVGFDIDNPGASTVTDWIENDGYPEIVNLGAEGSIAPPDSEFSDLVDPDEECAPSEDQDYLCHARPGLINSANTAMQNTWACPGTTPTLECRRATIMVYDVGEVVSTGGGAGGGGTLARYHPVAFVGLVFREMDKTGSDTYMDLEFVEVQWDGPIREVAVDAGVHHVRICSVDGDPLDDRCG